MEDQKMHHELYREFLDQQKHFNTVQNVFRTLASTWLLGAIGAAGFALKLFGTTSAVAYLLCAALFGASAIGIALLKKIDLGLYHNLLIGIFEKGLELEKTDSTGQYPKIHTGMDMKMPKDEGIKIIAAFYRTLTWLTVTFACASFACAYVILCCRISAR